MWTVKGYGWVKKGVVSFLLGVRGGCLGWFASYDVLEVIYIICVWAIWIFFDFQLWFDLHMCFLIDRNIWGIGDEE